MKSNNVQFSPFLAASILCFYLASSAFASGEGNGREVRVSFVQGDVRLSRGNGKRPDLKHSWEETQSGEPIEQGFAVATGNGRAEVEFENGSTVFLAENSLLLFKELPSPGARLISRMALPTGSATFWVRSPEESFFVETPTDKVQIRGPQTFSLRFDAYLDATAITPVGGKLENLKGAGDLRVADGQTVYFQAGAVLSAPDAGKGLPWKESADGTPDPEMKIENYLFRPGKRQLVSGDWDQWVEARVKEKETATTAALKASGLSSPVPGLADLYAHGTFFACEPYGTCWEPTQAPSGQESGARAAPPNAQAPSPSNGANQGFQPQTVQWQQPEWGPCDIYGYRTITRVARTPEELKELLRLRAQAGSNAYYHRAALFSCYEGSWIYHRGRYAMVLPRTPPRCLGVKCRPLPVRPPRPIFVHVGNKVGFVPRHPDDVKGKPPVNLKNGIIVPSTSPGQEPRQITWDPSQKLTILDKPPKEFAREIATKPLPVAAPEIHAHLVQETMRSNSISAASRANPQIVYNYKTQRFMMPAAVAGAKARETPVGALASNGKIATFANGGSNRSGESSERSSTAASYNGAGNSGSHSSSSGSSGGSVSHSSGGSSGGSVSGAGSTSSAGSAGASHGSRPR